MLFKKQKVASCMHLFHFTKILFTVFYNYSIGTDVKLRAIEKQLEQSEPLVEMSFTGRSKLSTMERCLRIFSP